MIAGSSYFGPQSQPGSGGTLTGANNGLSVVGSDVELGGTLIKDTDIDNATFNLAIANGLGLAGGIVIIGQTTPTIGAQLEIASDTTAVRPQLALIDTTTGDNCVVNYNSNSPAVFFSASNPNTVFEFRGPVDVELDPAANPQLSLTDSASVSSCAFTYDAGSAQLNVVPANSNSILTYQGFGAVIGGNSSLSLGCILSVVSQDALFLPQLLLYDVASAAGAVISYTQSSSGLNFFVPAPGDNFIFQGGTLFAPLISAAGSGNILGDTIIGSGTRVSSAALEVIGTTGGQPNLAITDDLTGTFAILRFDGGVNQMELVNTNFCVVGAGISTDDPGNPGVPGPTWKLGDVVAAASVLDATQYLTVNIGGVDYKLALIV